ncbi:MAG: carbohydrate kinase [Sphingobacteriales bacterium]|nr:MAG: carbohydrate kinase [Sphingobacteriales bacterium]
MQSIPVIAIFDIGKTNKKLFLFDEAYRMVYERSARFAEVTDEDGDSCENIEALTNSVFDLLNEVLDLKEYDIKAVNFSTYGASFVYIDENGKPLTPLYNYLKPYPENLKKQFYAAYGGEAAVSKDTASPVLGSLNSGMQLYRLKHEKPEVFKKIKYALHLPQYLSFLVTGEAYTDLTSIGCHTGLWDFNKSDYHQWVKKEGALVKFAPVAPANTVLQTTRKGHEFKAGIGLHDSSAALIPYLVNFHEPFLLLSTGTWSISLNPFNHTPLTPHELNNDCLCYLQYRGKPVKASRYLAGMEHDQQSARIAAHFKIDADFYKTVDYDRGTALRLLNTADDLVKTAYKFDRSVFALRKLSQFESAEEAYHQLIFDIVQHQHTSTQLVLADTAAKRIFVDGGFSKNVLFMNMLANAFPDLEVFAASMAQATAIGTALAIHNSWNSNPPPGDIIELKHYSAISQATI